MSTGKTRWGAGMDLELMGSNGEQGDRRLVAWQRSDGAKLIETNGDPVEEEADGFAELWAELTE